MSLVLRVRNVPSVLRSSGAAIALLVLLLAWGLPVPGDSSGSFDGADGAGTANELLDRAFRNLYAEDYIQTLVLATQMRGGSEMQRRLQTLAASKLLRRERLSLARSVTRDRSAAGVLLHQRFLPRVASPA